MYAEMHQHFTLNTNFIPLQLTHYLFLFLSPLLMDSPSKVSTEKAEEFPTSCRGLGHILRNYVTRDNGSTCLLLRACPPLSC